MTSPVKLSRAMIVDRATTLHLATYVLALRRCSMTRSLKSAIGKIIRFSPHRKLTMRLSPEWKRIVRRAWSFRLNIVAGVLTALEFLLPYFSDAIPRGIFAGLSLLTITAANVARVMQQKGYDDDA